MCLCFGFRSQIRVTGVESGWFLVAVSDYVFSSGCDETYVLFHEQLYMFILVTTTSGCMH